MDTIDCDELEINIQGVPNGVGVVINRIELEIPNAKKIFQFVLLEDVQDAHEDIMPFLANFEDETNTVKPFMGSSFDENGIFRKNFYPVYPAIYRKNKKDLLLLTNCD